MPMDEWSPDDWKSYLEYGNIQLDEEQRQLYDMFVKHSGDKTKENWQQKMYDTIGGLDFQAKLQKHMTE